MKSFVVSSGLIFCFAFSVSGQSGRKVETAPTPVTNPTVQEALPYSESTPIKRRSNPLFTSPGKVQSSSVTVEPPTRAGETAEEVVKVETDLITIPVSVFDRNGLYVRDLKQDNFKIFEDGKEQQIAYFGTADKPFTVVLLIDTSPSTEYRIDEIRTAAKAFVNQLQPQDRVMVIEFDGNVHVLAETTGDRKKIYKGIDKADFGWGTALYDGVDFSLRKRLSKIQGRKAIVLFTDGVDTQSTKAGYDSTLNLAEESDALIFPIYYNTFSDNFRARGTVDPDLIEDEGDTGLPIPGTTEKEYILGKKYVEELALYTGGRVFRPEATPGGLTAAFEGIAEELRRQYNIGYVPSEQGKPGQRKQIRVRVNQPNLVIRSRDSYIVGSTAKPSSR